MLGLMGDSADNIPGIKGVGEKTAVKLLKQFGTIENMLENTDQIKGKLREKVEAGTEDAIISKKLATIILDVPLEYKPESFILEKPDRAKLSELFTELEFRTLGKRFLGDDFTVNVQKKAKAPTKGDQLSLFGAANTVNAELLPEDDAIAGKTIDNTEHDYQLIDTPEKRAELLESLLLQKAVCFDTETTGIECQYSRVGGFGF